MYGRADAGTSSTTTTHHPAETTSAAPAASRCPILRPSVVGAAIRYASANPGTTSRPCSILVRKAKPISTPTPTSHRRLAFSTARWVA